MHKTVIAAAIAIAVFAVASPSQKAAAMPAASPAQLGQADAGLVQKASCIEWGCRWAWADFWGRGGYWGNENPYWGYPRPDWGYYRPYWGSGRPHRWRGW